MSEFLEFLDFCWNNKEDKRFSISKKIKYGWTSYYFGWDIKNVGMLIHVDSRNQTLELSRGYDCTILIEDPFLYLEMFNRCEEEYNNRLEKGLVDFVKFFFENMDDGDKDLSRIWKLNKMDFLDEEDI